MAKKIGLISDTHGFLDDSVFRHFAVCDEVWHAGDFGENRVFEELQGFKPFRGVWGNIDTPALRNQVPEKMVFEFEGVRIFMIHIGGKPPKYAKGVLTELKAEKPDLFICGHSHILKVMPDHNLNGMLYMNPGAAGHQGFHKVRTLLRFDLESGKVKNLEVIELGLRGRQ